MTGPLKLLPKQLPEGPEVIRPFKLLPKTSPEGPAVSRPLKLLPKTSPEGPEVIRVRKTAAGTFARRPRRDVRNCCFNLLQQAQK